MLKFLRKKTRAIVWIVVVSFIAWGAYAVSLQFEESQRSPGRIFGKEVSFREYQLAERTVNIFTPQSTDENPPTPETVEARVWEFLILSHEAKRRKIEVSDEEVRQEISLVLVRQAGGLLTGEAYPRWVRSVFHEEPHEFEQEVREHLRIRKLLAEVRKGYLQRTEARLRRWLLDLFHQAKVEVYRRPS